MRYLLQWLVCIFLILSVCDSANAAGPAVVDDVCKKSDGRLSVNAQGEVTDRQSGLQWVAGKDTDTSRQEAGAWIESLILDGAGWRLPAVGELQTLYDACGAENGVPRMFGLGGSWVWAQVSTPEGFTGRRKGADRYRAVALDSGKVLALEGMATFNLRVLAVRGESRRQSEGVYGKTVRGMASDRIYISTRAPAIRISLERDFTPVKDGAAGNRSLFNRKGEVAYVLIRHSVDIGASEESGRLSDLGVESWIAKLHKERIIDAGAMVEGGEAWLYVDRVLTGDGSRQAVFTRDLRLYVENGQFLNLMFMEALDRIDGLPWSDCRPLTARQRQYLEKVIDGFVSSVEIQKYSD